MSSKYIFTNVGVIVCSHGGIGTITGGNVTKLTINNKDTYTLVSGTIAGCTSIPPCITFSILVGSATKLVAGGQGLIRNGDTGTTNAGTCEVKDAGQSIVRSV